MNETHIVSGLATSYDLFRDVCFSPSPLLTSIRDFFTDSPALTDLSRTTELFTNSATLDFYTDGSLSNLASRDLSMGIG